MLVHYLFLSKKDKDKEDELKSKNEATKLNEKKNNIFSIEKLNIEINSYTNSKYYLNKKILNISNDNIPSKMDKNRSIQNSNHKRYELIPDNTININILSNKIKSNEIKEKSHNICDNNRKVKFDARILTIFYNENDKVPKLTIKDNKNKNVEFVPLDIQQ